MAGVVLVADSVWGYISLSLNVSSIFAIAATFTPIFFWSVVTFNIVMTLATGRIWWVARSVQPLLDSQQVKKYHTAIAIILESGAIYPLSVLLLTVTPPDKKYRV
ncbi:hypothetical protein DXG01_013406 [Tephrocybe rancida]|nr:hypothetical protein DXG01_013406 [Tephrocybe rancida]